MFSLPKLMTENEYSELESDFMARQISILKKKYTLALREFFKKYRILYNKVIPTSDNIENYPDEYFLDDERSRSIRERDISLLLQSSERENFVKQLAIRDIRITSPYNQVFFQ